MAEEALAPAIVDHQRAEDDFRDARIRVRVLREDLADTEEELELARVQFDERVVRAYKHGSVAADTALALGIFQEASSPGELASALKDLEVIAGFGAIRLVDLEDEIVHLQAALVTAVAERADAKQEVERTEGLIEGKEAEAAARRAGAVVAEANLLAATRRELETERAVERAKPLVAAARADYERVRDGQEPRDGDDDSPDRAEVDEDDADEPRTAGEWITNRERALARQRSLPETRRRAADDWICPVEDSRFVNDWAFPRSQERRHEGTDVFAPEGTPIVAAVDAEVVAINHVDRFNGRSGFGGLTVSYEADDARFYNAHLQRIQPGLEVGDELEAGDIIGWVGRTGNARGTPPHLHLGLYVDDVAVNPYPSLAVACADDGRATGDDADAELVAELDQRRADREARREERQQRREEQEDGDGPSPSRDGPR